MSSVLLSYYQSHEIAAAISEVNGLLIYWALGEKGQHRKSDSLRYAHNFNTLTKVFVRVFSIAPLPLFMYYESVNNLIFDFALTRIYTVPYLTYMGIIIRT